MAYSRGERKKEKRTATANDRDIEIEKGYTRENNHAMVALARNSTVLICIT